jgi:hypothetical protein
MSRAEVHHCECPHCQQEMPHPDQELHRQMNLLLSRLDEQQRRWYVAVEDGKNSLGDWRSVRSSGSGCPAQVGPAPKKRPDPRGDAGSSGAARNGG